MLDGLVGRAFDVMRPNDVFTGRFTVTAVNGNTASIVNAENHPSTVSVWSLMRGLHTILAEVPAPSPPPPPPKLPVCPKCGSHRTRMVGDKDAPQRTPPLVYYRCDACEYVFARVTI